MATLVLAAAGKAVGSALGLGSLGGILGKAAGALAGGVVDRALFGGGGRTVEVGKLDDLSVQTSSEGNALARVYGRVRLSGEVIWATRFEEVVNEENQGGKAGGSSTVRSYSYFGNFAVALCEGEIARIGRVWADGKLLDTDDLVLRLYKGTMDQPPDPLIEAVQGAAPAYRGIAYVVFERLPLDAFGNRLPQLSFEVTRIVEPLEGQIRAITMIPGAGEFVYAPEPVYAELGPGQRRVLNSHGSGGITNWAAALDELQDLCPNLESVALVIAWFGDDLRAGACTLRPKVETASATTSGAHWSVSGLTRATAELVSRIDDRPAFGGTPSDDTVIAAIKDLKARGLKVMLYPFVLMDIPEANGLPDPHGGSEQAAYPWRGRIVPGGDIAADAAAFFGTASAGDFSVSADSVAYSGPAEWRFRRHILHIAALGQAAGGVDTVLIGSELRGLTRAHAGGGAYPVVAELAALATEVRALVGSGTAISYAADWSEYGSHQPAEGELRFPLDPLWSHADIDFVGIDNYLPMADMRDGGDPDGNANPYDLAQLRAGIAGGENHDWYYPTEADRDAGVRAPITDGAHGKPWVYRAKDLKGWWQNAHFERLDGIELATPTGWTAMSKPIRFTELGVPAADRGANQPNVFVDPKSSESALPHFSRGLRDDLIQRRALEAHLSWWQGDHPDLAAGDNPVSPVYGSPMVDPDGVFLWTADARPFPPFPLHGDVWGDAQNWSLGHWLTGRLGSVSVKAVIKTVLAEFGIPETAVRVGEPAGMLEGYLFAGPVAARQVIEPLLEAFGGRAIDRGTHVEIGHPGGLAPVLTLEARDLALADEGAALRRVRAQAAELASEIRLSAEDALDGFRRRAVASRRLEGGSRQVETIDLPASCPASLLHQAAEQRLHRIWAERERLEFAVGPDRIGLEPGDVIAIAGVPEHDFDPPLLARIEAIEDAGARRIEAVRLSPGLEGAAGTAALPHSPHKDTKAGPPAALILDLPSLDASETEDAPRIAVFARPWPGGYTLLRSAGADGFEPVAGIDVPATLGRLAKALQPGPLWVFDRANAVEVELYGGSLESRQPSDVLAGANALAVRTADGAFEILQFVHAELTGPSVWRLTTLLRGQRGTEAAMRAGAAPGAEVVLLRDASVPLVPLSANQSGLAFNYRLVPEGRGLGDPASLAFSHASARTAARPLAPVHVRARRDGADIHLTWVRQTRAGGDTWDQVEVPLAEALEAYDVDILGAGDTVLRTLTTAAPELIYPAASEIADHGAPVTSLTVAVAQLSRAVGRGSPRKVTLHV